MGKYEDITQARKILGIDESETLINIKNKFKQLIKKYHPDVYKIEKEICKKKSEEIINSYKIIMNYCDNYILKKKYKNIFLKKNSGKNNLVMILYEAVILIKIKVFKKKYLKNNFLY